MKSALQFTSDEDCPPDTSVEVKEGPGEKDSKEGETRVEVERSGCDG